MTTTTQKTPPTPAQRLAAKIRARTDDTRDILTLLHDIAEGGHDATEHDKLTATGILFDRGYGKAPKQVSDGSGQNPETDDDDVEPAPYSIRGAIRESPAVPHKEPESPRLVSQLDDSLHESLGPAPGPCPEPVEGAQETARHSRESGNPESPDPFDDPSSIQSIIREHIISITNDGDTLIDVLMDIAWADDPSACPEPGRRVKPFHRNKAGRMLLDRGAGTDPAPVFRADQQLPEPSQSVPHNPEYPPGYIFDPTKNCIYCSHSIALPEGHEGEHRIDHEGLAKAFEDVQRMLDEQGITPDPNPRKIDWHISSPSPEWVANNIDLVRREAAEFRAKLDLQAERRAQWPEIEERRRKKLAQIYPSHSDDDDPPDP